MPRINLVYILLTINAFVFCWYFYWLLSPHQNATPVADYYIALSISFLSSVLIYYSLFSTSERPPLTAIILLANTLFTILIVAAINIDVGFFPSEPLDDLGKKIVSHDLIDGVYFAIVTYTTLGYGDIQPLHSMKIFSSLVALYGYINLGLLVSLVSHKASH